jgi:hypothetical protein
MDQSGVSSLPIHTGGSAPVVLESALFLSEIGIARTCGVE